MKQVTKGVTATILSMSLLTVMAGAAVAPALGAVKEHFSEANPLLIQFIVSMPALFIILTNLLFPLLGRVMRTKTMAIVGLVLYVVAGTGAFAVDNIWLLLVLRALLGVSVGIIMPLSTGLLAYYFPPEKIAGLMGLSAAMNQMGGVVATLLAGLLAQISWNYAFLVYLMGLIALVMVGIWLPQEKLGAKTKTAELANGVKAEEFQPSTWSLLKRFHPSVGGMLILMMIFFIFPTNFALTGRAFGISQAHITELMVGLDLVAFFVGLAFGKMMQQMPRAMKYMAPVCFLLGMICFSVAKGTGMLMAGCLLTGIANGVGVPYLNTIASIKGGKEAATTVMPLLSAALYLGQFVSPIIVSPLARWIFPGDGQGAYKIGIVIAVLFLLQVGMTRRFQSLPPKDKQ